MRWFRRRGSQLSGSWGGRLGLPPISGVWGGVPTFLVLGHPHALGNSSLPLGSSWAPMGVIQNLQGNQIETTNPQRRGRWGQKDFAVKSKIQMEGRSSHHRDLIKQTTEFSL